MAIIWPAQLSPPKPSEKKNKEPRNGMTIWKFGSCCNELLKLLYVVDVFKTFLKYYVFICARNFYFDMFLGFQYNLLLSVVDAKSFTKILSDHNAGYLEIFRSQKNLTMACGVPCIDNIVLVRELKTKINDKKIKNGNTLEWHF